MNVALLLANWIKVLKPNPTWTWDRSNKIHEITSLEFGTYCEIGSMYIKKNSQAPKKFSKNMENESCKPFFNHGNLRGPPPNVTLPLGSKAVSSGIIGPMGVKNPLRGRQFTWKKRGTGRVGPVNSQDPNLHQFLPWVSPPKEIAGRCCCWNLWTGRGAVGGSYLELTPQKFDEWMDTAHFPCICHGCR